MSLKEQRLPPAERMSTVRHSPSAGTCAQLLGGAATGNEQLTAIVGVILILGLAILGVSIVAIGRLLWLHLFVGMALIPLVVLKMVSTGYRFARYYTFSPLYRHKGPPPALLRLIAPGVLLSTIVVFGSGVALLVDGPRTRGWLLPLHKASFVVWIALTTIHVLGHLLDIPRALRVRRRILHAARHPDHAHTGRAGRVISVSTALLGGLSLALLSESQYTVWLHAGLLSSH
jgi:hypothetical protein